MEFPSCLNDPHGAFDCFLLLHSLAIMKAFWLMPFFSLILPSLLFLKGSRMYLCGNCELDQRQTKWILSRNSPG